MNYDPLGYYKALDADFNTDERVLKITYREKAKFWHPDHNKADNAVEEFQKLSLAYDTLKDVKSRTVYNLLALVYDAASFPDMKNLKLYKAVDGTENPFLRVFLLQKVTAGFTKPVMSEEKLVGTFNDAQKFIKDITKHNWLKGWWTPRAAAANLKALKANIYNINRNPQDNLKLLVHNAALFYELGQTDKAWLSAYQALEYASDDVKNRLQYFLNLLPTVKTDIPQWNYQKLKKIQLVPPLLLGSLVLLGALIVTLPHLHGLQGVDQNKEIPYYQQVRFNSGQQTVDDVIVSKIFNIPVDISDTSMLYHLKKSVDVMYGPSDEFDVLQTALKNQTVRVTGYTPDQTWYRIMLDSGEMGFVKKDVLQRGVGTDIPQGSKIFDVPASR